MKALKLQKDQDWSSRKYRTAWFLTFIFLGLFVLPPTVSLLLAVFLKEISFIIISSEAFITVITLIWAAYFGANVTEKHKSFIPKNPINNLLEKVLPETTDLSGGQPPEQ